MASRKLAGELKIIGSFPASPCIASRHRNATRSLERDMAHSWNESNFSLLRGLFILRREERKVKITIIGLSAAALIATTSALFAQGVPSKTPGLQHMVSKKHHPAVSGYASLREMQAKGSKKGHPRAFGYAPGEISDRETEITRKAGGGSGM
jgi:hypothetical protein